MRTSCHDVREVVHKDFEVRSVRDDDHEAIEFQFGNRW